MAELEDLDGVGPTRAERLDEAGYGDMEALAEADHEELAEEADVPEDTALEFVVQAQNVVEDDEPEDEGLDEGTEFDLEPKDVSEEVEEADSEEEEDESEDSDDGGADVDEDVEDESTEEDEPTSYEVVVEFENDLQYHVFHHALMDKWTTVYTSRQPASDALRETLSELTGNSEEVTLELSSDELNELHSAVLQRRTDYQGENLIDHMDALREVEAQVDEQRAEYLF